MPEENQDTDMGNMRTKSGKDHACGSGHILSDRQTDAQTYRQTHTSPYFATAPADEVMKNEKVTDNAKN